MKMKWNTPELIILIRETGKVNILSACKGEVGGGPEVNYVQCQNFVGYCDDLTPHACVDCTARCNELTAS